MTKDKPKPFSSLYPKVTVELGMGDGRLLESLAKRNSNSLFIGIELDSNQYREAKSRISLSNVVIMNSSFEDIVPRFLDESIDQFISVLPDPAFIDNTRQEHWRPFYTTVYFKLKKGGKLRLVTELTDELWQPVGNESYSKWADWLKCSFMSLGFTLSSQKEGAPRRYLSHCLQQFRGDPQRIRLITLDLLKQR